MTKLILLSAATAPEFTVVTAELPRPKIPTVVDTVELSVGLMTVDDWCVRLEEVDGCDVTANVLRLPGTVTVV
jgi:hypothetical protein